MISLFVPFSCHLDSGACAFADWAAPAAKPATAAPPFKNPLRLDFFESMGFSFADEVPMDESIYPSTSKSTGTLEVERGCGRCHTHGTGVGEGMPTGTQRQLVIGLDAMEWT